MKKQNRFVKKGEHQLKITVFDVSKTNEQPIPSIIEKLTKECC